MQHRISYCAFALLLSLCLPIAACAQGSSNNEAARKARIVANLKFSVAQLAEVPMSIVSIEVGEGEFDKGVINLAGQQNVSFMISKDDKQLYLLATDAVDASRSDSDLAALQADDERKAGLAAVERGAMLLKESAGLPIRGNPDAPITIIEFSDFECPYCARATETVDQVLEEYGDEVRLVYMHLPLESLHPWALDAAITSACAAAQDDEAFWALHDFYFSNQGEIELTNLKSKSATVVQATDINMSAWNECVDSKATRAGVVSSQKLGQSLGITGTPAFFVNGRKINGAQPIDDFHQAIRLAKMDMAATE